MQAQYWCFCLFLEASSCMLSLVLTVSHNFPRASQRSCATPHQWTWPGDGVTDDLRVGEESSGPNS